MLSSDVISGAPVQGRAYLAGTSKLVPAILLIRSAQPLKGEEEGTYLELVGEDETPIVTARLEEAEIDAPIGSAPRKITFPDNTLFETDDHAAVAGITGKTNADTLHHYEAFKPRLFFVVAVALGLVWLIYRYGLDVLVAAAIAVTPPVLVDQIDRGSLKTIDTIMASPTKLKDADVKKVGAVYDKLIEALDPEIREAHDFKLLFRDMEGVGPNAFAMPGGTMVMTDQFVQTFPEEDVLAGVLGHEIGHVAEQHGLRQIYRSLAIFVLIAFIAGDTGPVLEEILLEGNLLLSLNFSRKHERAADQFGLNLAKDAGFDPSGLKIFFERIREMVGDQPSWLSSHPSSSERIKAIEAFIDGTG